MFISNHLLFLPQNNIMAYGNIVIAHRVIVTLFLLHYIVKLALLLLNRKEGISQYTKMTRIAEMVISAAFLVTGIWLLVQKPMVDTFQIIKFLCVLAAIPVAIVGFKKSNKALAVLAVGLIFAAYGLAEMHKKAQAGGPVNTAVTKDPLEAGKIVYLDAKCNTCHGYDGKQGMAGAKDLSITQLTMDEQKAIIKNGKTSMPGHPDLTDEQLTDLVQYMATFRK
jgi:mono/diheme cytochrome c family protein